jgi:hypothetical protein
MVMMPLAGGIYPLMDAFQNTQLSNNYEVRELNGTAGRGLHLLTSELNLRTSGTYRSR